MLSFSKLDAAIAKANEAEKIVSRRLDISRSEIEAIGQDVCNDLQQELVGYLMSNYRSSGLKVKTGKLISSLRRVKLIFKYDKKPSFSYAMPKGVSDYQSGSNFYEVAESQNSGALIVRKRNSNGKMVDIIKEKAKKSLKKKIINKLGKNSKANMVSKGYNFGTIESESDRSVKIGGQEKATLIKPRNFFDLTEAQKKSLTTKLEQGISARLAKKLKE